TIGRSDWQGTGTTASRCAIGVDPPGTLRRTRPDLLARCAALRAPAAARCADRPADAGSASGAAAPRLRGIVDPAPESQAHARGGQATARAGAGRCRGTAPAVAGRVAVPPDCRPAARR